MRRVLASVGLLLMAAATAGCAATAGPTASATVEPGASVSPAPRSVFVVGDSNSTGFRGTFATGQQSGDAWASRLPAGAFAPVEGWAVDGATTGAMRAGVEALDPHVDQLVVMAGTNDLATGVATDIVRENLAAIAAHVDAPEVLVLAIAPFDALAAEATALNAELRAEATARGWDFFDPWTGSRTAEGTWVPASTVDGVHATREGYAAAGDAVAAHLGAP
ncbi:hypothetical protein CHE218_12450 [Microbacterium sp. che218]